MDDKEKEEQPETEYSVVTRGDNFPIVDLRKYNTEGKEAHYIQVSQIIKKVTENNKENEENK